MTQSNFVVVANRLPVDRTVDDKGEQGWRLSPGGLVTALIPVMKAKGGAWVGWHGAPDEKVEPFSFDGYQIVPVELSAGDVEDFYEGMSNATFWPLYHDVVVNPEYHREWWHTYVEVNQRFADEAIAVAAPGATVWVQDYQLQLVPKMIREKRPDLRIGFFLHIPFPPREIFMQLPWRREVIEGLLGADVVGFQVAGGAANFRTLARRLAGAHTDRDRIITPDGRRVLARAYPISIDTAEMIDLANTPEVQAEAKQLLEDLGNPETLFLSVDRLDYTKGLRQRVRAFGELFETGELDPDTTVFLQVATPSRERVREYAILREDIDRMIGSINSQVGRIGHPPISYRHQSYPRHTMAAMFLAADVCVVTPVRDGMNLVAKEYIAAHGADDGALVLSEFAGAAVELRQAYLVNPYDLDAMKETLVRAATDTKTNRRRRMRAMRKHIIEHDIKEWADDFLSDLDDAGTPEG